VINYLLCHACDLARYGQKIADLTFPHPTITGTPRQEVADVVSWMISLFQEEAQREEKEWLDRREKTVQKSLQSYSANRTLPMPSSLPALVLSQQERERLKAACLHELRLNGLGEVVKRVDDFVRFCRLISLPENHIKVASGQYIERQVNTYTTQEMTNQMAQELVKLPLFQAYTKIIDQSQGKQIVRTHRIQTHPLPAIQSMETEEYAIANGHKLGKKREDIEAEIRERQNRWGRGGSPPPQSKRIR
jgi:hypothetical protein